MTYVYDMNNPNFTLMKLKSFSIMKRLQYVTMQQCFAPACMYYAYCINQNVK